MKNLQQFLLNEAYLNLFTTAEKLKHADQIYELLQKTYAPIGGIKGSGLDSAREMAEKIPFIKLVKRDEKIVAGVLYKDKNGRKVVASFTDGSEQGKAEMAKILLDEMKRSYAEKSSKALAFSVKILGIAGLRRFAISISKAEQLLDEKLEPAPDDDPYVKKYPELKEFFYRRMIGTSMETKIMLGTPGKKII